MLGRRRIFAMEPLGSRGESPTLSPAGPPALEPTLGPGAPSTSRPTLHTDPGRPTSPRPPRGLSLEGSSDLRLAQETLWVSALNWPPPPSRFPRVHFPQISDLDSSPPAPVPAAVAPSAASDRFPKAPRMGSISWSSSLPRGPGVGDVGSPPPSPASISASL